MVTDVRTCVSFRICPVDWILRHALQEEVEDGGGILFPEHGEDVEGVATLVVCRFRIDSEWLKLIIEIPKRFIR